MGWRDVGQWRMEGWCFGGWREVGWCFGGSDIVRWMQSVIAGFYCGGIGQGLLVYEGSMWEGVAQSHVLVITLYRLITWPLQPNNGPPYAGNAGINGACSVV